MKKMFKPIAIVLTFAMVMSVMVMPITASAALHPNNLAVGGDFEGELNTNSSTYPYFQIYDDSYIKSEVSADDKYAGSKSLKITVHNKAAGNHSGWRAYAAYQGPGYYYASVQAKAITAPETASVLRLERGGGPGLVWQLYPYKTVATNAWTKLESISNFSGESSATSYVRATINCDANSSASYKQFSYYLDDVQMYKVQLVQDTGLNSSGTLQLIAPDSLGLTASNVTILDGDDYAADGTETEVGAPSTVTYNSTIGGYEIGFGQPTELEWGGNYVLKVRNSLQTATNKATSYLYLNFSTRVKPLSADLSIGNHASGVEVDTEVMLTFTNAIPDSSTISVALAGGNGSAAVTQVDSKNYKVTLSGLDTATPYTLTVSGAADEYGQILSETVFNFTTSSAFNLLKRNGLNPSFEEATGYGNVDGTLTAEIVERGAEMPAAFDGSKYLKVTGREEGSKQYYANVGKNQTAQFEAGKTYEASYRVRTIPDANGDSVAATASVYLNNPSGSNSITFETLENEEFTIGSGSWTKVYARFTVSEAAGTYEGIDVGFNVDGTASLYIDSYDIKEYIPPFTVTTNPADGATNVRSNVIYVTFSNAPLSFDETNVSISGSATIEDVSPASSTEFVVTLGNTTEGETYTLTITDVEDDYNQFIIGNTRQFTLSSGPVRFNHLSHLNPSFETSSWTEFAGATEGFASVSAAEEGIEAKDGLKVLKVTGNADSMPYYLRYNSISSLEYGKQYMVTGWVRTVDGSTASSIVGIGVDAHGVSQYTPSQQQANITPNGTWQQFRNTVSLVERPGTTNVGCSIYFFLFNGSAASAIDLYFDDLRIYEIIPAFTVETDFADESTDLDTDMQATFTFSDEPWSFSPENIVLKKGDDVVNGKVSITRLSATKYTASFTGLDIASSYTFSVTGVQDQYEQIAPTITRSFSTTAAENIAQTSGTNYSFEEASGSTGTLSGAGAMAIVPAEEAGLTAPHGDNILGITGRAAGSTHMFTNIGVDGADVFEAGKKYTASVYVRTQPNSNGDLSTDTAALYIENPTNTNTIKPVNIETETVEITSGGWTKLTASFDVEANVADGTYTGIDLGCTVTGDTSVYIDKYSVREYINPFKVTVNPEDGETAHNSNYVTYTFTNAPVNFTAENINFTGGEITNDDIIRVSDTVYMVDLGSVDYNTDYTIAIAGIMDKDDQSISKTVAFTTCSGDVSVDANTLTTSGRNYSFEDGLVNGDKFNHAEKHSQGTNTVVSGVGAPHGSNALKLSGQEPLLTGLYNVTQVEIGKKYRVSYWARTASDMGSASASVSIERANTANNTLKPENISAPVTMLSGTWRQVAATVDIVENNNATEAVLTNRGFHIRAQFTGDSIYIDNFQIVEIPAEDFDISFAAPSHNADRVSIDVGTIVVNYNATLNESFDPAAAGAIKLYKGEEDVTSLISNIQKGFGNSSIKMDVAQLENNTEYKLVITGANDFFERDSVTTEVIFTTVKAIDATGLRLVDGTGAAVDFETATAAEVTGAKIDVANASGAPIANPPIFLYTIYDTATREMVKIGSTAFTGSFGGTLDLDFGAYGGTALSGKTLTLYLVNSYDNLSLLADPLVREFD